MAKRAKNQLMVPKKLLTRWFMTLQTHFVTATPHRAADRGSVCVFVCLCCLLSHTQIHTHTDFSGHICIFPGGVERDRMLTPPAIVPQVSPLSRRVVSTSRRCTSSPPCCASPAYCPQSRSCRTASRTGAGSSL